MRLTPLTASFVLTLAVLAGCNMGPGQGTSQGPAAVPVVEMSAAVSAALQQRPGRAVEAEMKSKDGVVIFEIDVLGADGLVGEVQIGANGQPISGLPWQKAEAPEVDPEIAAIAPSLVVDLATALQTALQAAPGTARSVEPSSSGGVAKWKVKIRTATGQDAEIRIDAGTGQVIPR